MMAQAGGRILIAEDEPVILTLAQSEFEDAGYEVLTARDGRSALATLEQNADIALLFTDIRMPGDIDGWTLAKSARQLKPDLPVIYATGFSEEHVQLVEGAMWFTKPYRLSSIVEAAASLLQAQR
jgi:CheY-like chemotaxis protein